MTPNRTQYRSGRSGIGGHLMSRAGFTLFEMLMVLAIMSLSVALVVPRLAGSLTKMNARTAAGKIAGSLRYARSQAVAERTPYLSEFDLRENRLEVRPADSETEGKNAPATAAPKRYHLPDGVRLELEGDDSRGIEKDSKYVIVFFPTGGSSGGEILIRDEEKRDFTVRVDFITGSVQLTE